MASNFNFTTGRSEFDQARRRDVEAPAGAVFPCIGTAKFSLVGFILQQLGASRSEYKVVDRRSRKQDGLVFRDERRIGIAR